MSTSPKTLVIRDDALSGKGVVVTGSSRGLGLEIAARLARAGGHLGLIARSEADLAREAQKIIMEGGSAQIFPADLEHLDRIPQLVEEIAKSLCSIDVLVNNVGLALDKPMDETSDPEIDRLFCLNVRAPLALSREISKHMIEQGVGRIINIASSVGVIGASRLSVYGASKAALIQWTKAVAIEWAKYGITVNSVAPGYFMTELNAEAFSDETVRGRVLRKIPLREFGDAAQLAELVAYLASDASSYVTGQTFVIDGGMSTST